MNDNIIKIEVDEEGAVHSSESFDLFEHIENDRISVVENEIELIMISYMIQDVKYVKKLSEAGVNYSWFSNSDLKLFFKGIKFFYDKHNVVFTRSLFMNRIEVMASKGELSNPILSQYEEFYNSLLEYEISDEDFAIKLSEWKDILSQERIKKSYLDFSQKLQLGEDLHNNLRDLIKDLNKTESIYEDDEKVYKRQSLNSDADLVYDYIKSRVDNPDMFCGYTTGYDALDESFSGVEKGKMLTIMGNSSSGKTTFARNITRHIQKKYNAKICVISCEETAMDYLLKIVCAEASVPLRLAKKGEIEEKVLDLIKDTIVDIKNESERTGSCYEVIEVDARKYSIEELEDIIEDEYGKGYFDVVLLDHLSLVKANSGGKFNSEERVELGDISKFFRDMARRHNFAAILIAQANRSTNRYVRNKRVTDIFLENIEGSNKPGQDTDKGLAILSDPENPEFAIVKVVKDRDGERDYQIEIKKELQYCRFANMTESDKYSMGYGLTQEVSSALTEDLRDPITGEQKSLPIKNKITEMEDQIDSVLNSGQFSFE